MRPRRWFLLGGLCAGWLPPKSQAADFSLRIDRLLEPLKSLSPADRKKLDASIALIRRGENLAAFAPLMEIVRANPNNSGARVVLAYTMLQLGNLAGAFDHARQAEKMRHANSYVCLFLARVAAVAGDAATCKRELDHAAADKSLSAEAAQIRRTMAKTNPR